MLCHVVSCRVVLRVELCRVMLCRVALYLLQTEHYDKQQLKTANANCGCICDYGGTTSLKTFSGFALFICEIFSRLLSRLGTSRLA